MLANPHSLTLAEQFARESAMHWYTLAIEPQSWRKIGERAVDLGYETYCPMGRFHVTSSQTHWSLGQSKTMERPLLGSYIFVDMPNATSRDFNRFRPSDDPNERPDPLPPGALAGYVADPAKPTLETIQGCRGWVSGPNGPTPLHEAVIARMRRREAAGEFDMTLTMESDEGFVVPKWYRRNLTVEFLAEEAPLRGKMGKISAMSGNGIVAIWVPFFRSMTLVHAPIDWIGPAVE